MHNEASFLSIIINILLPLVSVRRIDAHPMIFGVWVLGFHGFLRDAEILLAELMALKHGLLIAWEYGVRELICYSDSLGAIAFTHQAMIPLFTIMPLLLSKSRLCLTVPGLCTCSIPSAKQTRRQTGWPKKVLAVMINGLSYLKCRWS